LSVGSGGEGEGAEGTDTGGGGDGAGSEAGSILAETGSVTGDAVRPLSGVSDTGSPDGSFTVMRTAVSSVDIFEEKPDFTQG